MCVLEDNDDCVCIRILFSFFPGLHNFPFANCFKNPFADRCVPRVNCSHILILELSVLRFNFVETLCFGALVELWFTHALLVHSGVPV